MLIILSPAKSMNSELTVKPPQTSNPQFLEHASDLAIMMRSFSSAELATTMRISDKLSSLNVARFEEWKIDHTHADLMPAILAFDGEVYRGFDAKSLSGAGLQAANRLIRILSGLYGILRPLDALRPYRLEMGTKFQRKNFTSLPSFWQPKITQALNSELNGKPLVNLASNEYSAAVDFNRIDSPIINPVFKDKKNGKYKIISFYAKKARGLMARFVVDHEAASIDDILNFDSNGYVFSEAHSTKNAPCFIRDPQEQ